MQAGAVGPPHALGTLGSVGQYPVLRVIGTGGMGLVVLAREPGTDRFVAIKLLRPELRHSPSAVKRFLGEARHMSQLAHPHLLRILAIADQDPHFPHYVMPYIARGSLGQWLGDGHKPGKAELTRIAREVAEAVAFAHGRGIIHRDLKPANVLIGDDGAAQVCDFGLVRTVFNDTQLDAGRPHLEGSAPYMSPAVARGEAEDTRCDIYSFGAMLYEMLTGRPPYEGRTTQQVIDKILTGPPEPIRKVNPQADARLARVAETCMARALRDRYASMADVADDLRRIERGEAPRLSHRRASRFAWTAVVCTALVLAGTVLIARPPRQLGRATSVPDTVSVPTFDLFADFPRDGRAKSPWEFGAKATLGGPWQPLDRFERTARDHPMLRGGATTWPAVICNPFTTMDFVHGLRMDAQTVTMVGEPGGPMPVARFTAPEAGRYEVNARIDPIAQELSHFGQILFVVLNDRRLAMAVGTHASPPRNWAGRLVALEAGDRLDFVLAHPAQLRLPGAQVSVTLRRIDALAATQPSMPLPRPMTVVPTTQPAIVSTVVLHAQPRAISFDESKNIAILTFADGRVERRSLPGLTRVDSIEPRRAVDLPGPRAERGDLTFCVGANRDIGLDRADGRRIWSRTLNPADGDVSMVLWLDDESVAYCTTAGRLARARAADGGEAWSVPCWSLRAPAISMPESHWLLACVGPGAVGLFDTTTGAWRTGFAGNMGEVLDLAVDPEALVVRTAGTDGSIRTWSLTDSRPLHVAEHVLPAGAVARFTSNGAVLLVGDGDGKLTVLRCP